MPEIIIVDEVGTEAEAMACRTIAERGVMLISTAHGQLLENLIKNPTLSDLVVRMCSVPCPCVFAGLKFCRVTLWCNCDQLCLLPAVQGGIQSVTLGDDEARARGTQKTVLERNHAPTFPLLIEMRARANWVVHWVEDSVDSLLTGRTPVVQCRYRHPVTRKVVISQSRYSVEDDIGTDEDLSACSVDSLSALGSSSFDERDLPGTPTAAKFANNIIGGFEDDQYAWAQKLRDIPDKDALSEMATMGYIRDERSFDKYSSSSFSSGTGSGKRSRRKNSSHTPAARNRR